MNETMELTMTTNTSITATTVVVSDEDRRQYLQQLQDETTITMIPAMTVLIIIAFVGVIGNTIVLFVYSRSFKRNPTRILIITISVLDIVANVCAIPGEIYDMFHIWDFDNRPLCQARMFANAFVTISAGLALLAVAVFRYRKVCKPHEWQITNTQAKVISLAVTIMGALFSIPYAVTKGRQTKETSRPGILAYECSEDDTYKDTIWPVINNGFFLLIFILSAVPLTIMYICIGVTAWKSGKLYKAVLSASTTVSRSSFAATELPTSSFTLSQKQSAHTQLNRPSQKSCHVVNVSNEITENYQKIFSRDNCLESSENQVISGEDNMKSSHGMCTSNETTETDVEHDDCVEVEDNRFITVEDDKVVETEDETFIIIDDDKVTKTDDNAFIKTEASSIDNLSCEHFTIDENMHYQCTSGQGVSPTSIFGNEYNKDGKVENKMEEEVEKWDLNEREVENKHSCFRTQNQNSSDNNENNAQLTQLSSCAQVDSSRNTQRDLHRNSPEYLQEYCQNLEMLCRNVCEYDVPGNEAEDLRAASFRIPPEGENDDNCDENAETKADITVSAMSICKSQMNNTIPQESSLSATFMITTSSDSEVLAEHPEARDRQLSVSLCIQSSEFSKEKNTRVNIIENGSANLEQNISETENITINNGLEHILNAVKGRMANHKKHRDRTKKRTRFLGRTTAILIVISAIYVIGFLPYISLAFFVFIAPDRFNTLNMTELAFYNLFLRLYYLNSAANPISYSLCGGNFRRECLKLMRCR